MFQVRGGHHADRQQPAHHQLLPSLSTGAAFEELTRRDFAGLLRVLQGDGTVLASLPYSLMKAHGANIRQSVQNLWKSPNPVCILIYITYSVGQMRPSLAIGVKELRILIVMALAAMGLLVIACGNGEEETPSPTPAAVAHPPRRLRQLLHRRLRQLLHRRLRQLPRRRRSPRHHQRRLPRLRQPLRRHRSSSTRRALKLKRQERCA